MGIMFTGHLKIIVFKVIDKIAARLHLVINFTTDFEEVTD